MEKEDLLKIQQDENLQSRLLAEIALQLKRIADLFQPKTRIVESEDFSESELDKS